MRIALKCLAILLVALPVALPAQSGGIPTPESVFGFAVGADKKLANYEQVVDYYRKVDAASDRVKLVEVGKSTQGRTFTFALVSSKANLDRIDRYREIARRLAHPEGLSEAEARALAREGKAFVHIDGGLHSSEVAGPQHTPLLLYDILRRANERDIAAILDNVILMLWPTINPDGHSMVADHYMARVGTPNESQGLPVLYQEYVGHDNNRDAYMLNMVESRVMEHAWREWEPNIIYVHHQSAPFPTRIWLPPFAEPIATHTPYLMSRELNMIGMAIAQKLEEEGKVGATHMGTGYDAWYPGYIDFAPVFKNIPAFWTETQGGSAAPTTTAPDRVPANMRQPQSLYASPWLGGTWKLRDAVDYMETASIATLDYAARYKDSVLFNRYQAGRAQIAKGRAEAPYAYIVPQDQRDPGAAVEMLRRLAFAGLRVYQLTDAVELAVSVSADMQVEAKYPAGTWIIPTDQEFAALAREVLDVQKYPEIRESPGGPLELPYDAAGWTLPLSMGVAMTSATSPLTNDMRAKMRLLGTLPSATARPVPYNMDAKAVDAAAFDSAPSIGFDTSPVARAIVPPAGRITGAGPALAVSAAENNAFKAINRAWKLGASVRFERGGPDGRYVISGYPAWAQEEMVKALAIRAERVAEPAGGPAARPRIGLFLAPTSMDEGWTRWVLDSFEFEYVRVSGADVQAGSLRNKIEVLIISDEAGGVTAGAGRGRGAGPGAAGPPAAPAPDAPNNEARIKAIDEFVRGGGTLVCFNRSGMAAVDQLKLPVRNVVAGLNRQQFFVGTSLLTAVINPAARVTAGMPGRAALFYSGSPVFETLEGFKGAVLARYPENENPLASGFLQGEQLIQGKVAALDVEHGQGHVILLGFRPQWRGQPFGTFRMMFNAAVYGAATLSAPSAFQQGQQPFEPKSGMPGKDVVWVPTPPEVVEKMLDMAKVTAADFVVDLGSGDGRNVIAAAKRGARAVGFEYNPDMVELSRRLAREAGVADKATFVQGDMYEAEFSKATVLALFLLPGNLEQLKDKILALKPGTRMVLNTFTVDGWEPDESVRVEGDCTSWCQVLLHIVPAKVAGRWSGDGIDLVLNQDFQKVTGTIAAGGGAPAAIADSRLGGAEWTFTAAGAMYSARVDGSRIVGTSSIVATGRRQGWTVTKRPE